MPRWFAAGSILRKDLILVGPLCDKWGVSLKLAASATAMTIRVIHFVALVFCLLMPPLQAEALPGKTQHLTSAGQVPEGLAKSDWQSIRAAYDAGRHAFRPVEGGWQARNPGQQWNTTFDSRGFVAQPREGGWQWGLELKRYGFRGQEREIGGKPAVTAAGTRLSYQWDETVQEWWVNDNRGLEHGFTVQTRPMQNPSPSDPA